MIPTKDFLMWCHDQERRSVTAQIKNYLAEKGLKPTIHEVQSLKNGVYGKLRKSAGAEYPTIDYTMQPHRAAPDTTQVELSASRELAVVTDAIQMNGFPLPEMQSALEMIHSTHAKASVGQQKAAVSLVKASIASINNERVKRDNAEELGRWNREALEEARRDKEELRRDKERMYQMMLKMTGGSGGGNNVV